jgi:hypothetical protein
MAELQSSEITAAATEAQIAVHWKEESYLYPSSKFIGQANLTDPAVMARFSEKTFQSASENTLTCWLGTSIGKHLPHLADRDPNAKKDGRRRACKI